MSAVLYRTDTKTCMAAVLTDFEIRPIEPVQVLDLGVVVGDESTHFAAFPPEVEIVAAYVQINVYDRSKRRLQGCRRCGAFDARVLSIIATPMEPMRVVFRTSKEMQLALVAQLEPLPVPKSDAEWCMG